MAILGFGALFAGFLQIPGVTDVVEGFLEGTFEGSRYAGIHPSDSAEYTGLGGALSIVGIAIAYLVYVARPGITAGLVRRYRWLHDFLERKWYFDEAIDGLIVRPSLAVGRWANSTFERYVIQGLVAGATGAARGANAGVRGAQSGYLRSYALLLVTGFAELGLYCCSHEERVVIQVLLCAACRRADRRCLPPGGHGWVAVLGPRHPGPGDRLAQFDSGAGLQHTVDESWIPDLGVRYQLGIDGISLFLVLLTAVLWLAATLWSALNTPDRLGTWFLMFGLAETAVLGAFLAQDLILFVLFFDLMLIPFYFLFGLGNGTSGPRRGGRGADPAAARGDQDDRLHARRVAADAGRGDRHRDSRRRWWRLTYSMAELREDPLGTGSQYWIFWFFAAAFLVKMPAFPLHGWMPDAYRVAPCRRSRSSRGALQGRGLRLPSRRPADLPRRDHPLPGGDHPRRSRLHPLRLGDGVHPDERPAGRGLLLGGAARIHHAGDLQPAARRRRRRGPPDGQPRARRRAVAAHRGRARGARGDRRHHQDGWARDEGAGARSDVPDRDDGPARDRPRPTSSSASSTSSTGSSRRKVVYAFVASVGIALAAYYALRLYQAAMHNRKPEEARVARVGWGQGGVIAALTACIVALALWPG